MGVELANDMSRSRSSFNKRVCMLQSGLGPRRPHIRTAFCAALPMGVAAPAGQLPHTTGRVWGLEQPSPPLVPTCFWCGAYDSRANALTCLLGAKSVELSQEKPAVPRC